MIAAEGQESEWHKLPDRDGKKDCWVWIGHPYDFVHPDGRVQRIGGCHSFHYTSHGCYLIEFMGSLR